MKKVASTVIALMLAVLTGAAGANCLTDSSQSQFQAGVATNLDLTTSPGDVQLASSSSGGSLDQESLTNNLYGDIYTDTQWLAQTFKAGASGPLTRVDVYLACAFCGGTTSSMTVSILATSGGVPSGGDLASTTIPPIATNGDYLFYSANFATPATVSAGTTYAIVLRQATAYTGGKTIWTDSALTGSQGNDVYADGALYLSTNSGSSWSLRVLYDGNSVDAVFKTYVGSGGSSSYVSAGDLISSLKDSSPPTGVTPAWSTLSWNSTVPGGTVLQFQVAVSNSSSGPFVYLGPDGTSSSYFTSSNQSLSRFAGYRYLKYRAYLSTSKSTSTPVLNDVTVCYLDTADTSITVDDGSSTAVPGSQVVYTVTASNAGPATVTNATVSDAFPASLTSCHWTCAGSAGGTCSSPGSGNINDATVDLPSGGSATYTATCTLSASATGTIANSASIANPANVTDSDPGNNTATDTDTLTPQADLQLTVTDNQDTVQIGNAVDYVMQVTNRGPSDAQVTLTDNLPSQLSNVASWVCTGTSGVSCSKGNGNTMSTDSTIPAGGTATYVYSSTVVSDDAGDSFSNAAVASVNNGSDPNSGNNTASDTDIIVVFLDNFEGIGSTAMKVSADGGGGASITAGVDGGLLNNLGPAPVTVATGRSNSGSKLFSLQLMRLGGEVMMRSLVPIDGTVFSDVSPWQTIDLRQHLLGLQWSAASSRGDDGYLRAGPAARQVLISANNAQADLTELQVRVENGIPWLVPIEH